MYMEKSMKSKQIGEEFITRGELENTYNYQKKVFDSKIDELNKTVDRIQECFSLRFGEDIDSNKYDVQIEEIKNNIRQVQSKNSSEIKEIEKRLVNSIDGKLSEIEVKNQKNIGAEAFIRWQSPTLGFLLPEKFLPLFEKNGFIISIDYFVLEEVCKVQRKLLDEGKEVLPIAVNQSGLHMTEEDYLEKTRKIVEKYKLPKNILKLDRKSTRLKKKVLKGCLRANRKKGLSVS